jgi:hypothetical protein
VAPADWAEPTIRALAEVGRTVPPEELRRHCASAGLAERRAFVVALPGQRRLFTALYEKPAPPWSRGPAGR